MDMDLSGKKLLLTGGSGGIGSAIMDVFSSNGAVVIAPSSSELNLLDEKSIDNYFEHFEEWPDFVIHSAGINELAGITEVTSDIMKRVFQVNFLSFSAILKKTIPYMQENGFGRIVGISSLYGVVSRERRIAYSSSKHAMTGLIQSTALELADRNILINGVAPGYVLTEMTKRNLSPLELDQIKEIIPTKRFQEAEEIADLCLFLCSPMNKSITGQIIPVDGGFLCK